jgi:hypothetical protein
LPSTPGKIPSSDNPYALGAAFEAATWLLGGLEQGIAGPLEGVGSAGERRVIETALEAPKGVIAVPASTPATEQIVTEPYGQLSGSLPAGWQAHHLNQNAVYGEIIPRDEGLSVGMRGNAFNEPGTSHFAVHQSMEQFWDEYRKDGNLFNEAPTNAEYGEASRRALIAGGLSPAQATELAAQAAAQRAAYGLSETSKIPRVPGRINQTQR